MTTAVARAVGAIEPLKDMRQVFFPDARAKIANRDGDAAFQPLKRDSHHAPGVGILDRVIEQQHKQAMQRWAIAGDDGRACSPGVRITSMW